MRKQLFPLILLTALIFSVTLAQAQGRDILLLAAEGPVTPAMASYFERGIREAERTGATAVLITLDTPGGNLDPMQDIVRLFRAAEIPVIIYISPAGAAAASAGSVITVAAHVAAMAPETVIGAASPVGEGGADLGETIFRKITEDMSAQMRSLTQDRGEAAMELAQAMITEARAVHAEEALEVGLIDIVADDLDDLLAQLDGRTVIINDQPIQLDTRGAVRRPFEMNLIEQLLHALSNPVIVSILLVIGVQAILIELGSPGGWVAGFIGVLALGLGIYGLGQLPANWLGLGLVAVAFVLFVLEVKTPAVGGLAIAGTLTLLIGLLIMFNSPGTPQFARISIPSALTISLGTAAFFVFAVTMALRAQQAQPATGMEGLLGQTGPARGQFKSGTDQPPYTGTALIHGEIWRAVADEPLAKGDQVEVTAVTGFTLSVRKIGPVN